MGEGEMVKTRGVFRGECDGKAYVCGCGDEELVFLIF